MGESDVPYGGGPMTKSQVLAPPELVQPLNLQPIIVADPKRDRSAFCLESGGDGKDLRISDQHHRGVQSRGDG